MHSPLARSQTAALAVIAAAFGILLQYAIPVSILPAIARAGPCIRAASAALLSLLIYLSSVALCSTEAAPHPPSRSTAAGVLRYLLPCAAVWTLYLLAFYPAIMTGDSVEQWRQILAFRFSDRNPLFHTFLCWLVTRPWSSPAALALFQMASLAAVVVYGMRALESRGAPAPFLAAATCFYSLWPLNGFFAVTLWKDIPYSICVLWLTVLLARVADSRGGWLSSRRNVLALGAALVPVCLLRHNGIVPVFAVVAGLLLFYRPAWRGVAAAAAVAGAGILALNLALYRALPVTVNKVSLTWIGIHQIAGVISAGGEVTEKEYAFLTGIGPRCYWRRPPEGFYNRYDYSDLISGNPDFKPAFLAAHRGEFVAVWRAIVWRNLRIAVGNYLAVTSIVWRITQPPDGYTFATATRIWDNRLGLVPSPRIPALTPLLTRLSAALYDPRLVWLMYRPALFLYLCIYFPLLRAVKARDPGAVLVSFPTAFTAAGLMIGFCQDSRLLFAAFLCAPFAAGHLLTSARTGP